MSDGKCVCGHAKSRHSFFEDHDECSECSGEDPCSEFRTAEEEKPENKYERARKSMSLEHYDANLTKSGRAKAIMMQVALIDDALRAGEAAEKCADYRLKLVEAQSECLEETRRERDEARARVAELQSAYLLEKERRIAAESKLHELCREVLTAGRYDHARDLAKALDQGAT